MPAKVTADYSQFPESIQEVMPHVEGEVMELRNLWSLFGPMSRNQPFLTNCLQK
jgi:hypothetical protein